MSEHTLLTEAEIDWIAWVIYEGAPSRDDMLGKLEAVARRIKADAYAAGLAARTSTDPRCDTCQDAGRVAWMIEGDPNCYQETDDEGMIPCPDCTSSATADTCPECKHRLPHDERWGCLAEVGEGGSGSVADATFCNCRATADGKPEMRVEPGGER